MKVNITVPEVVEIFNVIHQKAEGPYEMIHIDLRQTVGEYLKSILRAEMSNFLGREPYDRQSGGSNHRNGTHNRKFALKGFGEVFVKFPVKGAKNIAPRFYPAVNSTRRSLAVI